MSLNALAAGIVGLLVGAVVGVLAGAALGRHDDRTLLPWWMGAEV